MSEPLGYSLSTRIDIDDDNEDDGDDDADERCVATSSSTVLLPAPAGPKIATAG